MCDYRGHQRWDVIGAILVICIRVDDDVSPQFEAGLKPCHERPGKSLIRDMAANVIHPRSPGNFHRAIS